MYSHVSKIPISTPTGFMLSHFIIIIFKYDLVRVCMYESVTKYAHWSNYAICGMENFEISKMDFMSKQGTEKRR